MPVIKVPVVHKFGIISHSHRLDLQRRIREQNQPRPVRTVTNIGCTDITEDFVHEFNKTSKLVDRRRVIDKATKILERVKRKLGVKDGCSGNLVDVVSAWTDLSLLAQCKDTRVQEDSLQLLIVSLDRAVLDDSHIAVLFYLAEFVLYVIRTESVCEEYLSSVELQLLTVGRLVFTRLYFHHMAGHLGRFSDLKSQLHKYIDGFTDVQQLYSPYPNAVFNIRYICDVGQLLTNVRPNAVNDADVPAHCESSLSATSHSSVSVTVHELSPSLWHALDVWRCATQAADGFESALKSLANCGGQFAQNNWVDVVCALEILAEAAKVNIEVLSVLQDIASGYVCYSPVQSSKPCDSKREFASVQREESHLVGPDVSHLDQSPADAMISTRISNSSRNISVATSDTELHVSNHDRPELSAGIESWPWELGVVYADTLCDIVLNGATSSIQKLALVGQFDNRSTEPVCSCSLLDLACFRMRDADGRRDDCSWRIRFVAMQSLMTVCDSTASNSMKDGQHSAAWNGVMKAKSLETDLRVLEALKTYQACSSSTDSSRSQFATLPSLLGANVAAALSRVYLPPLPPAIALPVRNLQRPNKPAVQAAAISPCATSRSTNRNSSTKSARTAAYCPTIAKPSFESRTIRQLQLVVADQWEKEQKLQLFEEENENLQSRAVTTIAPVTLNVFKID